jgi:hypothetical protein
MSIPKTDQQYYRDQSDQNDIVRIGYQRFRTIGAWHIVTASKPIAEQ